MSTRALRSGLPRVGFIGAGRLGKALAWSLANVGVPVVAVANPVDADARALAERIEGCLVMTAQEVADGCDLVFVVTPDGVIEAATQALRWRAGMGVVHCSGATEVSALNKAREDGALTGGFHPMQTFGDPMAAVASLPGSTITIEAPEPLDGLLGDLARRLGCHVNRLPPGMRGRYHAAAGFTSQFINALFDQAAQVWASWGATPEDTMRALIPLARGTLASIESAGIAAGMPGPVSRGDLQSVDKHLDSLAPLGPEMMAFYRLMCGQTIPLAQACGGIDAATAARFREALDLPNP